MTRRKPSELLTFGRLAREQEGLRVFSFDGSSEIFVTVAYGISEDVDNCHPGERKIESSDPHAGLGLDTKFDIGNRVKLPFDDAWFAASPNLRFGVHPKRGKLNLDDNDLKRRLSSAIAELKKAGRPKAVDMITRSAGRKKPKS